MLQTRIYPLTGFESTVTANGAIIPLTLTENRGGHTNQTLYVGVNSLNTSTFRVKFFWAPSIADAATNKVEIGTIDISATGMQEIPPTAPFNAANYAIPAPNCFTVTQLTGVGGLRGFYQMVS